jgi:hypothetical protein
MKRMDTDYQVIMTIIVITAITFVILYFTEQLK